MLLTVPDEGNRSNPWGNAAGSHRSGRSHSRGNDCNHGSIAWLNNAHHDQDNRAVTNPSHLRLHTDQTFNQDEPMYKTEDLRKERAKHKLPIEGFSQFGQNTKRNLEGSPS